MQVHSFAYDLESKAWSLPTLPSVDSPRTLVLAFGAPDATRSQACFAELARLYPRALVVGCSTAGEIHGTELRDDSVAVTVTRFEKTDIGLAAIDVASAKDSFATGQALAKRLASKSGLRSVLILSEGLGVNGTELVRGVNSVLDPSVVVTGGLSGDGTRFKETWVAVGPKVKSGTVAAVGFYGDHIQVGHGSKGGWDKFGPERVVTRSEGNVLYELDGKPALLLYKEYLGDKAKDLPASGLLFPLSLRSSEADDKALVRTLLGVDHEKNSLTFAGDIPKGWLAQLMKADFDRLIGGASIATTMAKENGAPIGKESLVVAISCVGRRLVLGERTEEEIEAVLDVLPKAQKSHITGFYSYGELSPYASGHCDLHNQTMTLTVFSESQTPLPRKIAKPAAPPAPKPAPRAAPPPPPEEIDFEIETSRTNTRKLSALTDDFRVASFGYDLSKRAWSSGAMPELDSPKTLVLAFGAPELIDNPECFAELAKRYPQSVVVGCSSAGEIHGTLVKDQSLSVTVSRFTKTELQLSSLEVDGPKDSFLTGQTLARKLAMRPGLRGVLILSEGLNVNGSELVRGVNEVLDESIVVTGGLSGDGTRFKRTWVAIGAKVKSNVVAAVGFYGDHVQIGHGSKGGWDKFGPERVVTRSEGNVLYELDGKPALLLYKEYLGDKAKDLPASGLLFPLSLRSSDKDPKALVRTLLAVDHEKNSLTFAGDIPKGWLAQLMKADFDRLIGGASLATAMMKETGAPVGEEALVLAISCVGRRLVLGERTEEEIEAVLDALPKDQEAKITGFYSYGELSPYASGHCDLHNQTMTLTVFSESQTPLPKRAKPTSSPEPHKTAPNAPPNANRDAILAKPALAESPAERFAPPAPRADARSAATSPISGPGTGTTPSLLAPAATPLASPPPSSPRNITRAPLQAAPGVGATVQRREQSGYTVVTVTGRLTETFGGEALGRELRGNVVIDLGAVERITSFGVREWLAMLGALDQVRRLYLARCSEAVVNQLAMIRKFAGNGQIVSFFAPYLCGGCGEQFERRFDCEAEAESIRNGDAPKAPCPHCGAEGNFDDDPRSYFAFAAPHLVTPVPAEVRAILDALDAAPAPAPRDAVDKTVDGNVTRVRVQTKLSGAMRWSRILDGIEGALVVDLGAVTGIEPAGIANFEQALGALGPEVTSIAIERCPSALVDRFVQMGTAPRVSVTSAALDAFCRACAVHRPAIVSIVEHGDALAQGRPPRVHCKRCNGDLELQHAERALAFLQGQRSLASGGARLAPPTPALDMPASIGGMAVTATPAPATPAVTTASLAPTPTPIFGSRRATFAAVAIGALSVAVVGLGAVQFSRSSTRTASASSATNAVTPTPNGTDTNANATKPPEGAATTTQAVAAKEANHDAPSTGAAGTAWMQNVDLPPAWVERAFVIEGSDVLVVGKSEVAPNAELAIQQARTDALVRLVKQVHQDLAGTATYDFVQPRLREGDRGANDAIAARYAKQHGITASPERVDAALRKRDAGVEGFARYKLTKATYQQVVASYRETSVVQGMTIGRFFPLLETTLHSDGDLVVLAVQRGRPAADQGVRPGDVVLAIGSRPTATVDALTRAANDEWTATPARGTMNVEIESAGAKRTVRFFKPGPPGP